MRVLRRRLQYSTCSDRSLLKSQSEKPKFEEAAVASSKEFANLLPKVQSPPMLLTKSSLVLATGISAAVAQFCEHQWDGPFAEQEVDGVPYVRARQNTAPPPLDIQPLIINGPSENRIDLIFFGDGCM